MAQRWTDSVVAKVIRAMKTCESADWPKGVLAAVSKAVGFPVSRGALEQVLIRYGKPTPIQILGGPKPRVKSRWTVERFAQAEAIARECVSAADAAAQISAKLGFAISPAAICNVFQERGKLLSQYFKQSTVAPTIITPVDPMPRFAELLTRTQKKGPIDFAQLCDTLELPPKKVKELIERSRASGVAVHVENDHVGIQIAQPIEKVQPVGISPIVGKRQIIGVISDTHLGSKFCLREQLKDCVHHLYERGVREIVHPGDACDGDYGHGKFEMTHMGIVEQTRDLFETLPQLPGLNYRLIGGNHDYTFTDASGIDAPEFYVNYFRKRGRNDLHAYGNRGAFLKINGAVIHLWHPKGGGSYARSYNLQKKIEGYTSIKPQILLAGHWHFFCYVEERGVHAMACPTFQAGQSAFGKSLSKGAPSIGGLLLGWDLTRDGTMRSFSVEKRSYFEVERPLQVMNTVDGMPVEIDDAVTEPAARTLRQGKKAAQR